MCLAGRDDIVARLRLLKHAPHGLDVVAREPPVAAGVEIPQLEVRCQTEFDARDAVRDFAGHELASAAGARVVEEDPRAREQAVALPVVDRNEVTVDLRDPVRAAGIERR